MAKAIRKALAIYAQPELLRQFRRNAMQADFSWAKTVGEYLAVYRHASKSFAAEDVQIPAVPAKIVAVPSEAAAVKAEKRPIYKAAEKRATTKPVAQTNSKRNR